MSNYHLEVKHVSRGKGHSLASRINYITGRPIRDTYLDKTYYDMRRDVLYVKVLLPEGAPSAFQDLNYLCRAMDCAERRWDARTARSLTGSLPNELTLPEWTQIVEEFVKHNFVDYGLCAIAAIHQGKNPQDPQRDNPHVHILVSTRTAGPDGFKAHKAREYDKKDVLQRFREDWARTQNRAYERNGISTRVSHKSLEEQGIDRVPMGHLSHIEWQRERTKSGDRQKENRRRNLYRQEHDRQPERSR